MIGGMKYTGFISGKIKVLPEDFLVKEHSSIKIIPIQKKLYKGKYFVYLLKKKDWNTLDILIRIAKENRIPLSYIQYGGKKDRHALTFQYITSKKKLSVQNFNKDKVELICLGKTNTPMSSNRIIKNEFQITIRSIQEGELNILLKNYDWIQKYGLINYYDSQRFSSFRQDTGFPFFSLLIKDYESFLRKQITHAFPSESRPAKDRKYQILQNWGDWRSCLEMAKTKLERQIFEYLCNQTINQKITEKQQEFFFHCINFFPREEIKFMFSSFQSYVWNHSIASFIKKQRSNMYVFKTKIGDMVFPSYPFFVENEFPLIHYDFYQQKKSWNLYWDEILEKIVRVYLNSKQMVDMEHFLQLTIKNQSFARGVRKIVIKPENFRILEIKDDDIYKNKKLIRISFFLESGSYATMVLKRLLLRT